MTFSVPQNALIVIADGQRATLYRNTAATGIKIEKTGEISAAGHDGKGAAPVPTDTTPNEFNEASFAKHIANDLYERVHKGGIDALVIVADPQTLGQMRPSLHKEVQTRITGELHKTLTNSSVSDIEGILTSAAAA